MDQEPIAHVRQLQDGTWVVHPLKEHLQSVGALAAEFASCFGNEDWAYLAGLWHDLGKYSREFQSYIKSASGYLSDAHIEGGKGKVDHSTAGAIHAIEQMGDRGRIIAFPIAGHHAGLGDWQNPDLALGQVSVRVRKRELLDRVKYAKPPDDIITASLPTSKPPAALSSDSLALWIRMLFSCLVDADFLDTEAFMDQNRSEARAGYPSVVSLKALFDSYLSKLAMDSLDTEVNRQRNQIREWCVAAAGRAPGIFRLTVPTGGGKTLSSMAFALDHAVMFRKRRIVYVIPYTSIVEQTADILRTVFGDESVIEHHSNFDPEQETVRSRLACENWDAPIIVTTSVQFFESLFAARTSKARKLHRIVDSVVILDEAQMIPTDYLQPILDVLNDLSAAFGVSIVLSTATQPGIQDSAVDSSPFRGLKNVTEIIPNPAELYKRFERVKVSMPESFSQPASPDTLAQELLEHERVLCILNRKDECRELFALMPTGTYHLSGYMCGQHRSEVICKIKAQLKSGETPLRVVSTQLVEAGVDFDFPVVFRAFCGLDSIAQAAGRCNREGLLHQGLVRVFISWKKTPRGHLSHMEAALREVVNVIDRESIFEPVSFDYYFKHLYWIKGSRGLDRHNICAELCPSTPLSINFKTAAKNFNIIDDNQQKTIFVRFGDGPQYIDLLRKNGPERWLLRKLQRFSISIPIYIFQQLIQSGELEELHPGLFCQAFDGLYHPQTGFLGSRTDLVDPDYLII